MADLPPPPAGYSVQPPPNTTSTLPPPPAGYNLQGGNGNGNTPPERGLGAMLGEYWDKVNPAAMAQGLTTAVLHPLDTARAYSQQNNAIAQQAQQAFQQGNYSEGMRHVLGYFLNGIPGVGSGLDEAGNKAQAGDTEGAIADTAALATQLLGLKYLPKAASTLGNAAGTVKNAAQGTVQALRNVDPALAKEALGVVSPRAAHAIGTAERAAAVIEKLRNGIPKRPGGTGVPESVAATPAGPDAPTAAAPIIQPAETFSAAPRPDWRQEIVDQFNAAKARATQAAPPAPAPPPEPAAAPPTPTPTPAPAPPVPTPTPAPAQPTADLSARFEDARALASTLHQGGISAPDASLFEPQHWQMLAEATGRAAPNPATIQTALGELGRLQQSGPIAQRLAAAMNGQSVEEVPTPASATPAPPAFPQAFHGTNAEPFSAFDPSKKGTGTDPGQLGSGYYFSTDRAVGRSSKTLLEAGVNVRNPLKLSFPSWSADKNGLINEALGTRGLAGEALTSELSRRGFDGVVLDYSPVGYNHSEIVAFDPAQVQIKNPQPPPSPTITPVPAMQPGASNGAVFSAATLPAEQNPFAATEAPPAPAPRDFAGPARDAKAEALANFLHMGGQGIPHADALKMNPLQWRDALRGAAAQMGEGAPEAWLTGKTPPSPATRKAALDLLQQKWGAQAPTGTDGASIPASSTPPRP